MHKLEKEQAELIDDILRYMEDGNRLAGSIIPLNYANYCNDRTSRTKSQVQYVTIEAALQATDIYCSDKKPPYMGQFTVNAGRPFTTTIYTDGFLKNGGFYSIWASENIKEAYTEQLRLSTLDTNASVLNTNKTLKKVAWASFGVSIISATFILVSVIITCNDQTASNIKEVSKQLEILNSQSKRQLYIIDSLNKIKITH